MTDIDQSISAYSNWIVLANGAGIIAAVQPEAAELSRLMSGIPGPGPQVTPEAPVEAPLGEPQQRPAESPEQHPDSRPQEHPDDAPGDSPDDVPSSSQP